MAQVERFEDKVKEALADVMKHAVAGHDSTEGSVPGAQGGYHRFCTNADHALHILAEAGIRPVNDAVAARYLDKGTDA